MTRKAGIVVPLGLGVLLVSAVAVTYGGENMVYAYELTFWSNFLTGLVLLGAAALRWRGKDVPQLVFLCLTCLLLAVFLISAGFQFGFSGGLFFLHLVDPLAVLAFFLTMCDMRQVRVRSVPAVLAMPLAYLAFALAFGGVTGNYIYPFLDYEKEGAGYTAVFVLLTALGLLPMGYGLYFFNRFLRKNFCAQLEEETGHGF